MSEKEEKQDETLKDALNAAYEEHSAEPEAEQVEATQEEEKTEEASEKVEAQQEDKSAEDISEEQQEEEQEEILAPEHWTLADREAFSAQPLEARKYVLDRIKSIEGGYDAKFKEIAGVKRALEPYISYLDTVGTTPEAAISAVLQTEQILRTGTQQQKQALLQKIIADYGLQAEEQQDDLSDPAIKALEQKFDQLQNTIAGQTQAQQETELATIEQQIQTFSEERSEAGQLVRPYFNDVVEKMVAMARVESAAGRKPDLQTLYDEACWANPSVRAKLLEAETKAASDKATEAVAEKAQKASKASASVSGAPVGAASDKPANLRETLEDAWQKAS